MRIAVLFLACAAMLCAQKKYDGPKPPKQDVVFLLHATNLVSTEVAMAKEEKRKDDRAYVVDGATSPAKTPMAEPVFLIESKTVQVDRLQLYKLDVKNGKREVIFPPANKRKKDSPRPLHLSMKRLGEGIYRLEANEYLQNGEYALTPEGSDQVFLFTVY
ncbi:MAG: hypothetical protein JNK48_00205 [Bryobacterales bacterium]|nr:hypothetical protein [Bryobacterales bacterium]